MPPARPIGIDIKHEGREYGLTSLDYMALAEQAERAGLESFWTNEDIGFDSLGLMSAASQRTLAFAHDRHPAGSGAAVMRKTPEAHPPCGCSSPRSSVPRSLASR